MNQLPQHVSAVSSLGGALNGTGSDLYGVPRTNGHHPAPTPQSTVWVCRCKGCSHRYSREDVDRIVGHLNMHLKAAGQYASIPLTVTPELSAFWLARSKRRRPISEANWRRIWMDLRENGWVFDGNPFGLDTERNLIQGGHRATAIVAAGMDVESALIGGLPPEAALVMDTGKPQTFRDVLISAGVTGGSDMAPVAGLLWRYDHGQLDPQLSWDKRLRASHTQLLRFYEARETELRAGLSAARVIGHVAKFPNRTGLAVACIAVRRVAGDEAKPFVEALALKGNHLPVHGERDPVIAWHRKWASQTRFDRLRPEEQAAITIKCWNFYARGQSVKQLRWRSVGPAAEPFPQPLLFSLAARDEEESAP